MTTPESPDINTAPTDWPADNTIDRTFVRAYLGSGLLSSAAIAAAEACLPGEHNTGPMNSRARSLLRLALGVARAPDPLNPSNSARLALTWLQQLRSAFASESDAFPEAVGRARRMLVEHTSPVLEQGQFALDLRVLLSSEAHALDSAVTVATQSLGQSIDPKQFSAAGAAPAERFSVLGLLPASVRRLLYTMPKMARAGAILDSVLEKPLATGVRIAEISMTDVAGMPPDTRTLRDVVELTALIGRDFAAVNPAELMLRFDLDVLRRAAPAPASGPDSFEPPQSSPAPSPLRGPRRPRP